MSEKLNDGFVKVIDDFLPTPTFNRLRDFVLGTEFLGIGLNTTIILSTLQ